MTHAREPYIQTIQSLLDTTQTALKKFAKDPKLKTIAHNMKTIEQYYKKEYSSDYEIANQLDKHYSALNQDSIWELLEAYDALTAALHKINTLYDYKE